MMKNNNNTMKSTPSHQSAVMMMNGNNKNSHISQDGLQYSSRSRMLVRMGGRTNEKIQTIVEKKKEDGDVYWFMAILLFLFPALGGLLFGYDIGATSGALLSLKDAGMSGTTWSNNLSSLQSGLVVSLSLGGALLGSIVALVYGDAVGRRKEILGAGCLYALGALAVSLADSLPVLYAGRLVYGMGIGFAMHAAPAYIAETSPAKIRGLLISLKEAFIVGGILLGYGVSYANADVVGGWRYIYGDAIPVAMVLVTGMWWLPESPRWLVLSSSDSDGGWQSDMKSSEGSKSRAFDSLKRIRGPNVSDTVIETELEDIEMATLAANKNIKTKRGFSDVLSSRYRKPLTVGVSLMLFQQITGQPSVLYYAGKIFQDAGFTSADSATGISIVLGMFKLLTTGLAVVTVDSWGRRPLLLAGVSGIVVSLVVLGSVQAQVFPIPSEYGAWANLVALLFYTGAYQASFGPISWLIVGEVFPLSIRGQALALATLTNFGANFLVSLVIPSLQEMYGQSALYFGFAAIGVVALASIYANVPETKGKTLEEIEAMWK
jgi:sugar porter (SP) family MFS transporter